MTINRIHKLLEILKRQNRDNLNVEVNFSSTNEADTKLIRFLQKNFPNGLHFKGKNIDPKSSISEIDIHPIFRDELNNLWQIIPYQLEILK